MAADKEMTPAELLAHFREQRSKLPALRAPGMWMREGSDADIEFRTESAVRYALDFIDVLLNRLDETERRIKELETRSIMNLTDNWRDGIPSEQ